jgi:GNAT superfamily N-acetyltransferase
VKVSRSSNARAFLDRAEAWLLRREAEHNVLLGIARQLQRDDHPYGEPIYLATVETAAGVCGCAFRTPPFKLGLTRLPAEGVPLLVQDVAEVYTKLPAVLGPEAEARQFADVWSRRFGTRSDVGLRQRIHVLDRVVGPSGASPGALRRAEASDLALVREWAEGFARDAGVGAGDPVRLVEDGSMYLWVDGQPRSMAAAVGETPHGVRVAYVYTPPPFRRRGYATVAVASLSQLLLDAGRRFCVLYTDLSNPTSNAIYKRVGYRPVCDVVDINLS